MKNEERLDAKKRRILSAACRLLSKRGFQDIVLDDVAKAAGVAKGTLFLHYKNKSDLFSAVFFDLLNALQENLAALEASGLRGRGLLEQTVRSILVHFDEHHDFLANFGSGNFPSCTPRCTEKLMDKYRRGHARVASILKSCRRDGLFKSSNIDYAAFALFALCRSAMMEKVVHKAKYPLIKKAPVVIDFFLNGIKERG
ncbi:MAG: TetR/AcrR family transcriptional regulator [Elusimicrobiota bacterium]